MSTYTPISSITLTSTATSVTFSGIPQTYTDLVLVATTIVASGTGNDVGLRFNGDSASNYSNTYMLGTGTSAVSGRNTLTYSDNGYLSSNSGQPNTRIINIQNYANTTTFKPNVSRASGDNGAQVTAYSNIWHSTAAITTIEVYSASGLTYAIGTTFNLYGITTSGIVTNKATGGDNVYSDGTYWYHTFLSSGVFTPLQNLTVDYLVVAGGGAGGNSFGYNEGGGGGGAGGFRTSIGASTLSLTAQNYTVTVGAGGAGRTGYNDGLKGSDSVFSTITATGGGGGGRGGDGNSGGSGGGGGGGDGTQRFGGAGNTPSTSPSQGFNGGNGSINGGGGGGGGAGAVGGNAPTGQGGNGGSGASSSLSGTSIVYAGGGGGAYYTGSQGSGGSSIGGAGSNSSAGGAGATNTGSGGGGYANNTTNRASGSGGSGIVIVRYAV